jgi:cell division septal protein FtsQ
VSLFEQKKGHGRIKTQRETSFARQIFRGVIRLVLIAILLIATYYLTRLSSVSLVDVTVEGGETISHEEISAKIHDELNGNYFLIVPKRFAYLYPHDRMVEVLEKNPRMHNVHIERASRTSLHVTFDEYIPHALWCVYGNDAIPCYFIDDTGYAFAPAPDLHGGSLVRHNIEGIDTISEGMVMDTSELKPLDAFIARVESELGFRITALTHKKNKDYEFIVNGGGAILAASSKDLTATFENLKSVLASKEFKHIAPGNFRYIDVRFDNKVFVNEELSTSTESVATTSLKLPE